MDVAEHLLVDFEQSLYGGGWQAGEGSSERLQARQRAAHSAVKRESYVLAHASLPRLRTRLPNGK